MASSVTPGPRPSVDIPPASTAAGWLTPRAGSSLPSAAPSNQRYRSCTPGFPLARCAADSRCFPRPPPPAAHPDKSVELHWAVRDPEDVAASAVAQLLHPRSCKLIVAADTSDRRARKLRLLSK